MHNGFRLWLERCRTRYESGGVKSLLRQLYWVYVGFLLTLSSRLPLGTNVFERDWDMLIILDACRVDALREVANEYSFIESVDEYYSVASTSNVWIANTFTRKFESTINDTTYVTSNVWSRRVLVQRELPPVWNDHVPFSAPKWNTVDVSDLDHLDRAWEYADHSGSGGFPARPVTDRAITLCRERPRPHTIVHYMQPHTPYVTVDEPLQQMWLDGEISREVVWEAYLENLRYALDDVELLLENVDAEKVAITADHGEAFGEWGFYGHNIGSPVPTVRKVPWIETTATDTGSYTPESRERESLDDEAIEQRLEDLGYKS